MTDTTVSTTRLAWLVRELRAEVAGARVVLQHRRWFDPASFDRADRHRLIRLHVAADGLEGAALAADGPQLIGDRALVLRETGLNLLVPVVLLATLPLASSLAGRVAGTALACCAGLVAFVVIATVGRKLEDRHRRAYPPAGPAPDPDAWIRRLDELVELTDPARTDIIEMLRNARWWLEQAAG